MKALLLLALLATPAFGQTLNIDFGAPERGPRADFAAAGKVGVWNSVEGESTSWTEPWIVYDLVDVEGQATAATLHQFGGTGLILAEGAAPGVDVGALMDDALVTYTEALETCLWIDGLAPGRYEVITYAWMPEHPDVRSKVRLDYVNETVEVGGAFGVTFEEGVTHAILEVEVTDGFLGIHSGNVTGADLAVGAALNGVQIRPVSDGDDDDAADDDDDDDDDDVADDDDDDDAGTAAAGCSQVAGGGGWALLLLPLLVRRR